MCRCNSLTYCRSLWKINCVQSSNIVDLKMSDCKLCWTPVVRCFVIKVTCQVEDLAAVFSHSCIWFELLFQIRRKGQSILMSNLPPVREAPFKMPLWVPSSVLECAFHLWLRPSLYRAHTPRRSMDPSSTCGFRLVGWCCVTLWTSSAPSSSPARRGKMESKECLRKWTWGTENQEPFA